MSSLKYFLFLTDASTIESWYVQVSESKEITIEGKLLVLRMHSLKTTHDNTGLTELHNVYRGNFFDHAWSKPHIINP
jgi:hypothetical protein